MGHYLLVILYGAVLLWYITNVGKEMFFFVLFAFHGKYLRKATFILKLSVLIGVEKYCFFFFPKDWNCLVCSQDGAEAVQLPAPDVLGGGHRGDHEGGNHEVRSSTI